MKHLTSNALIVIGFVALIWIIIGQECSHKEDMNRVISSYQDSMRVYIDKNGKTHAESIVKEYTKSELNAMAKYDKDLAELKKQVKDFKNLQSHSVYEYHYLDTIHSATYDTVFSDGTKGKKFLYLDEWTTMKGVVYQDSVSVRYSILDEVKLTTYWKRSKPFSPKDLVIDVTNSNPHVVPVGLAHLELKRERKFYETTAFKVGVGLVGGAVIWKFTLPSRN